MHTLNKSQSGKMQAGERRQQWPVILRENALSNYERLLVGRRRRRARIKWCVGITFLALLAAVLTGYFNNGNIFQTEQQFVTPTKLASTAPTLKQSRNSAPIAESRQAEVSPPDLANSAAEKPVHQVKDVATAAVPPLVVLKASELDSRPSSPRAVPQTRSSDPYRAKRGKSSRQHRSENPSRNAKPANMKPAKKGALKPQRSLGNPSGRFNQVKSTGSRT